MNLKLLSRVFRDSRTRKDRSGCTENERRKPLIKVETLSLLQYPLEKYVT